MTQLNLAQKEELIRRMCGYVVHSHVQGIELVQITGEEITLRLPYKDSLVGNPDTGALHGGVITMMLDQTLGMAGLAHDQIGPHITPTLDLRIDHMGVAEGGKDLYAAGRAYRVTERIAFLEGIAWTESRHRPVARATGSFVIMPDVDLRQEMAQ